jgi:hypothetical protein
MALSTGWKIGIGAAVVGVGAWVIAALSAKPAKAATTPEDQPPPGGGKVILLDKHDGFVLVPGDMGTLTISEDKSLNARILVTAVEDKIINVHSSNPSVINVGSKNFTAISAPIMKTGEAVLTFDWTKGGVAQTSTVKVIAQ